MEVGSALQRTWTVLAFVGQNILNITLKSCMLGMPAFGHNL